MGCCLSKELCNCCDCFRSNKVHDSVDDPIKNHKNQPEIERTENDGSNQNTVRTQIIYVEEIGTTEAESTNNEFLSQRDKKEKDLVENDKTSKETRYNESAHETNETNSADSKEQHSDLLIEDLDESNTATQEPHPSDFLNKVDAEKKPNIREKTSSYDISTNQNADENKSSDNQVSNQAMEESDQIGEKKNDEINNDLLIEDLSDRKNVDPALDVEVIEDLKREDIEVEIKSPEREQEENRENRLKRAAEDEIPENVDIKVAKIQEIRTEDYITDIIDDDWQTIAASSYSVHDWREMMKTLIADNNIRTYAHAKSRSSLGSLDNLKRYLLQCPFVDTDVKKAWLCYLWITQFIEYDAVGLATGNLGDNTSPAVFNRGICVCEGYSSMFYDLCNSMGLTCKKVSGYSKAAGYKLGQHFQQTDHAWNMVILGGKRQLVECTWGAGFLKDNAFQKKLNPYYFCTPPQFFIYNHLPQGVYQQLDNPISLSQYEQMASLGLSYHLLGIECLSHKSNKSLVTSKYNPALMEFKMPKENKVWFSLINQDTEEEIKDCIFVQRDNEKILFLIYLENQDQEYKFNMNALCTIENYEHVCNTEYIIKRVESNQIQNFPEYDICFDGISCISHRSAVVFSQQEVCVMEFKVPKGMKLSSQLKRLGEMNAINKKVLMQHDKSGKKIALFINLDLIDQKYTLNLYANSFHTATFLLNRSGSNAFTEFPQYDLAFGDDNEIECISHRSIIINCENDICILEFKVPKSLKLLLELKKLEDPSLEHRSEKSKEKFIFQFDRSGEKIAAIVFLGSTSDNFSLDVYMNSKKNSESYTEKGKFLINQVGTKQIATFPKYALAFGNDEINEVECLSHRSLIVECEHEICAIEFKVPKDTKLYYGLHKLRNSNGMTENIVIQYDKTREKVVVYIILDSLNERYVLSTHFKKPDSTYERGSFLLTRIASKHIPYFPKYDLYFGDKYPMECTSHKSVCFIAQTNQFKMEFTNFEDNYMAGHLCEFKTGTEYTGCTLKQINPLTKKIELLVNLPFKNRLYILKIDYGQRIYTLSYASFIISSSNNLPETAFLNHLKYPEIKNPALYIYEPLCSILKTNTEYTFKIWFKNADVVWLEDTNKKVHNFVESDNEPDIWTLKTSFSNQQELTLKITYTKDGGSRYTTEPVNYKIEDQIESR